MAGFVKTNIYFLVKKIKKPAGDYPSFFDHYMKQVPDDGNLLEHLANIEGETRILLGSLSEEQLSYRYEKDKWTIKDLMVHLSDCERILTYRMMRIARNDKTDLRGFDETLFALSANAQRRTVADMLEELRTARAASLVFIGTLTDEELDRTGTANGYPISVRLLANHLYAHHRHHLAMIKEKYLRGFSCMR